MTCSYLDRDLDAYVDGELDAPTDAAVRAHVAGCAVCAQRVEQRQGLKRDRKSVV